jgi:hypothetical protein
MNLTNFWSGLETGFREGVAWLRYFLRDNPIYAGVVVVLVIVLWVLLKSEVRHK